MKNTTKITLALALVGTLGLGGLVKAVNASQIKNPVVSSHHKIAQMIKEVRDAQDGETKDDLKEQQEMAYLQSLAKITPQQAQQAAEKAIGGKASEVELENEDGNLVYSVLIGDKDVKVDAGNGNVLYTDVSGLETPESQRPQSSIQVNEGPNGDGDGETNDDR